MGCLDRLAFNDTTMSIALLIGSSGCADRYSSEREIAEFFQICLFYPQRLMTVDIIA